MFEFESPTDLTLGLVTGICFGFLLQKGRVAKYQTILGQLLLRDWSVFKIMLTAIVTGAVGVYFMSERDATSLDIWPFQPAAMIIGAVLFGSGLAVIGYCPAGPCRRGRRQPRRHGRVLGMLMAPACLSFLQRSTGRARFRDCGWLTIPEMLVSRTGRHRGLGGVRSAVFGSCTLETRNAGRAAGSDWNQPEPLCVVLYRSQNQERIPQVAGTNLSSSRISAAEWWPRRRAL